MKTLHIIPHSHWDREWYMSFEKHRMKLVELFDNLIEVMEQNPDYKYYHMDGQYIVVEDYLEIKPYMKDRLLKLIQDDRIQIGPWFMLQDQYLTSGEANVRNMLYGIKLCKSIGAKPVMCGYFPDSFGNISQAPQILKGFGIDYAAFGRGLNDIGTNNELVKQNGITKSELIWSSPDGSEVIGIMFANWYHNAMELPADEKELKERLEVILEWTDKFAVTPHLLGLNGCDHQPIQMDLHKVIAKAKGLVSGLEVKHSNFNEYCENVSKYKDKLDSFQGEIAGQFTNGLNNLVNTASSRIILKQLNHKSQNLLERIAEPVSSLAFLCGNEYKSDFFLYSWKKLMENHPHDSICACHVDEVNDEMITRFNKSMQVANSITDESLEYLAQNIDTSKLGERNIIVFNLEPYATIARVKVYVDFPEDDAITDFSVTDMKGKVIASTIKSLGRTFTYTLPKDTFRKVTYVNRFEVEMVVELTNGMGYNIFPIKLHTETYSDKIICTNHTAENEYLKLEINENGSLKITDKLSNIEYDHLNIYQDVADNGDLYNFIPIEKDIKITTINDIANIELVDKTPYSATFLIENEIQIPENLIGNKRSLHALPHLIKTYVTILKGIKRVDIKTTVENKSENHRLRAIFKNNIDANKVLAEGQFDVVEREITTWEEWKNPSNCQRAQAFVALEDSEKGLLIANKGLNEYEIIRNGTNTMALTLLRAVGEVGDWGVFPTPKGQCKGEQLFEYSIVPYSPHQKSDAYRQGFNFSNNAMVAFCTDKHSGYLPTEQSFVNIEGNFINASAMKKCEERDSIIFRIHNTNVNSELVKSKLNPMFKRAYLTNLNEDRICEVAIENNVIKLDVIGKKIVTIEFEK